ncbi:hypothetical protein BGLA2_1170014 [Burkholderia gladioli]|nr:hypothetical protein BGLA2_1170014 [Burkholderia gladioli]
MGLQRNAVSLSALHASLSKLILKVRHGHRRI